MERLAANNPAAIQRSASITQDRLQGLSYLEIAKKHNIDQSTVCRILQKDDAKLILEQGLSNMIYQVPQAIDVQRRAMTCEDDNKKPTALAVKASENILKTTSVMPSNVTNQTINTIYNIKTQNVLSPTVSKALLPNYQDDPDIIDADYQDKEIA